MLKDFRKIFFRLSFKILFTFWSEKEFGSYKTFWEKESLHGLVYLRFCVCRGKRIWNIFYFGFLFPFKFDSPNFI